MSVSTGECVFATPLNLDELTDKADELRHLMIEVAYKTGGAYLAQALSGIDLLTAIAYRFAKGSAQHPLHPDRDRILLSPGHYALILYVILADRGYFDRELLWTFKGEGSPLELATHRGTVPGVEVSGGSLGQTLSVGVGMALAAKRRQQNHKIFVFMSDGEQDEGQIWEAVASAAHFGLGNIVACIDANGFQVDGPCSEVMDMEPLPTSTAPLIGMLSNVMETTWQPSQPLLSSCASPTEVVQGSSSAGPSEGRAFPSWRAIQTYTMRGWTLACATKPWPN